MFTRPETELKAWYKFEHFIWKKTNKYMINK